MPITIACPSKGILDSFLVGRLSVTEVEQLSSHVMECAKCTAYLSASTVKDPVVEALKNPGSAATQRADPLVKSLISEVSGWQVATETPFVNETTETFDPVKQGDPKPSFEFLAPPQSADELGRLGSYRVLELLGTGAGLANLAALGERLDYLDVRNPDGSVNHNITDAGFVHLKTLTNLTNLNFESVDITDLVHLAKMPHLRHLSLQNTQITDAGLVHVAKLADLEYVSFRETKITDAGLRHLKGLTNLKEINLDLCPGVGHAGLEYLKGLNLRWLLLDKTKVSDAGMKHLKAFPDLERLDLAETAISDADLMHLHSLSKLAQVNLRGTKVSADGVAAMHKVLPGCQIAWNGGSIEAKR